MAEKEKNYFAELNAINVNDKVEKKNGLSYLSWAWAWAEVKKRYPDATYTIYEAQNGNFYHNDGHTCWVKTGVTINGLEHIEYLPVMDFRNQSIPLERVTSFDVNKAIQRSLTKAVARHGLGLYIYAGEDLPEDSLTEQKAPEPKKEPKKEPKAEQKPAPKPVEPAPTLDDMLVAVFKPDADPNLIDKVHYFEQILSGDIRKVLVKLNKKDINDLTLEEMDYVIRLQKEGIEKRRQRMEQEAING